MLRSVRRVPSLHSSVSLRLGYTCLLFLHTSAGKNPAGSVPGRQEAAVPAAGADIVSLVHSCAVPQTAKDCAGAAVPGLRPGVLYLRSGNGPSRPRPRRPSVCPSRRSLPLLQGACSLPSAALQSPPPHPFQTASGATLHSLRSFRALWHWQTHRRRAKPPPQSSRLRDCQCHRPTRSSRPSVSAISTVLPRPNGWKG